MKRMIAVLFVLFVVAYSSANVTYEFTPDTTNVTTLRLSTDTKNMILTAGAYSGDFVTATIKVAVDTSVTPLDLHAIVAFTFDGVPVPNWDTLIDAATLNQIATGTHPYFKSPETNSESGDYGFLGITKSYVGFFFNQTLKTRKLHGTKEVVEFFSGYGTSTYMRVASIYHGFGYTLATAGEKYHLPFAVYASYGDRMTGIGGEVSRFNGSIRLAIFTVGLNYAEGLGAYSQEVPVVKSSTNHWNSVRTQVNGGIEVGLFALTWYGTTNNELSLDPGDISTDCNLGAIGTYEKNFQIDIRSPRIRQGDKYKAPQIIGVSYANLTIDGQKKDQYRICIDAPVLLGTKIPGHVSANLYLGAVNGISFIADGGTTPNGLQIGYMWRLDGPNTALVAYAVYFDKILR